MRCTVTIASPIAVLMLAAAGTALAQQQLQPQPPPPDSVRRLGTVSVVATPSGRGETRGANAISKTQLTAIAAGTSPLKAIEKLPGVNTQSSDPWGAYEWANSITMRGFAPRQIGQTLDAPHRLLRGDAF